MIKRGEIYFVDLDPTRGREQAGKRPVLVVSSDRVNKLPLVVAVVAGTNGNNLPNDFSTNVRLSPSETGLPMETVFMCFQIRALDQDRFPPKLAGKVSEEVMEIVDEALRLCLEL